MADKIDYKKIGALASSANEELPIGYDKLSDETYAQAVFASILSLLESVKLDYEGITSIRVVPGHAVSNHEFG